MARGPRNSVIRQEVLNKAASLFAERGFASTSLQDIGDAVGLSRPALYYYFKNKDEILTALVEQATSYPVTILEKHRKNKDLTPAGRLHAAVCELVVWIIKSPLLIRVLESNESKLPQEASQEHIKAKRRVLKAFMDMVTDGINAGEFNPVDPRIAAFGLIGMANWTAWWYSPGGEKTDQEVGTIFADMALKALSNGGRVARSTNSVDDAIDALKESVLQLEQAVKHQRP